MKLSLNLWTLNNVEVDVSLHTLYSIYHLKKRNEFFHVYRCIQMVLNIRSDNKVNRFICVFVLMGLINESNYFFFYLMCGCVFVFVLRFGFVSLFQMLLCFLYFVEKKIMFFCSFSIRSVCGCCMCNNNYWKWFRSPCNLISIFQQYTLLFNIYITSQLHENQFNGNG